MSDNIVPFKTRELPSPTEPVDDQLTGDDKVVTLGEDHLASFSVPQPDGTLKHIDFAISEMDWWQLIALRTMVRNMAIQSEPMLYINTDPHIHEQGSWMKRRRALELTISKAQLLDIAGAIPYILTSTFNGMMSDELYMQLSEGAKELRVAEDEPDYTEALIIHPLDSDGETFCLRWVEV